MTTPNQPAASETCVYPMRDGPCGLREPIHAFGINHSFQPAAEDHPFQPAPSVPDTACFCKDLPAPHSAHELVPRYRAKDGGPALTWTDSDGENWNNGHDYANIRAILSKRLIGRTIMDITQHDKADFARDGRVFVQFMLDDGSWIKFPVGDDGFDMSGEDL